MTTSIQPTTDAKRARQRPKEKYYLYSNECGLNQTMRGCCCQLNQRMTPLRSDVLLRPIYDHTQIHSLSLLLLLPSACHQTRQQITRYVMLMEEGRGVALLQKRPASTDNHRKLFADKWDLVLQA